MDMSQKEIAVIKAAMKSRNKSKWMQPVLFMILVGLLIAMLFGVLPHEQFTYLAIFLVFFTIILPQLGGSPKYNELVDILEKKLPQHDTMENMLSQELNKIQVNQNAK